MATNLELSRPGFEEGDKLLMCVFGKDLGLTGSDSGLLCVDSIGEIHRLFKLLEAEASEGKMKMIIRKALCVEGLPIDTCENA